jgi:hypothetical protein
MTHRFLAWALPWLAALPALGGAAIEVITLPPLRIAGQPAQAHTQGLELVDGRYYVTARREDTQPRRALLLRTAPGRHDWDIWDITPPVRPNDDAVLDHPGGLQFDGRKLWIPIAESRRGGRTLICAFSLSRLKPGRTPIAANEFEVEDHIGALAVSRKDRVLIGASWDTETVRVWSHAGRLQRTLSREEQAFNRLGASQPHGLAVQDWKIVGQMLYASGLTRGAASNAATSRSTLLVLDRNLVTRERPREIELPPAPAGVEWAGEGAAVQGDFVYFLPEDLGASNRLFRIPLPVGRAASQRPHPRP